MAVGRALSPLASCLMELGGRGEGSLVLKLGTREGERMNTLWGASVSHLLCVGLCCEIWPEHMAGGRRISLASSQILFRVVLLLPGPEQESPLLTGTRTWQLLCISCAQASLLTSQFPTCCSACSPCRKPPKSGSFNAGDGQGLGVLFQSWIVVIRASFSPMSSPKSAGRL